MENAETTHPGRMRASVLVAQGRFGQGPGRDGDAPTTNATTTVCCSNDDADVDDVDDVKRRTTEETVKGMMNDGGTNEGTWERNALNTPAGFRANMEEYEEGESYASMRHALDALRGRGDRVEPPDAMSEAWLLSRGGQGMGVGTHGDGFGGESVGKKGATVKYAAKEVVTVSGASAPSALRYSRMGARCLAIGQRSGGLSVVRQAGGDVEGAVASVVDAHDGEIVDCDWSLNGSRLTSASRTGSVKTWNVNHTSKSTMALVLQSEVKVHAELTCIMYHAAHDDIVFVGTRMREILTLDTMVGAVLHKLQVKGVPLSFDCNTSGNVVFVGDDEGKLNVLKCDPVIKKTFSLRARADSSTENPLERVIQQRSASQTERMNAAGIATSEYAGARPSVKSGLRSKFQNMMQTAKRSMPRPQMAETKMGYQLKLLRSTQGSPSPTRCVRYCALVPQLGGAALLTFHDDGSLRMYHAEDVPYSDLRSFSEGRIRDWKVPNRNGGVASFSQAHSFELPLFSASIVNRTAIYLLPTTPGAPVQATQFTDDFDASSESGIDVATVSQWSYDGCEIAIGHSSGKIARWTSE